MSDLIASRTATVPNSVARALQAVIPDVSVKDDGAGGKVLDTDALAWDSAKRAMAAVIRPFDFSETHQQVSDAIVKLGLRGKHDEGMVLGTLFGVPAMTGAKLALSLPEVLFEGLCSSAIAAIGAVYGKPRA